jgi:UDP-N-acetylglucosamine 2-epimerase (non-hydrolysing)
MRVLLVAGARPNFMKVAPIISVLRRRGVAHALVHTGQHYDPQMSDAFFADLGLGTPDFHLNVGSGSHADQTARVMQAFEPVLTEVRPDWVVVVGDVNSTLACSLVAAKCHIPVAHVEAGLRSNDRDMPEEINRIVTDSISDYLFVTEQSGLDNLLSEGVAREKIHFVGNVMIDSLVRFREKAASSRILEELSLENTPYALMTMHRPSNVDREEGLASLVDTIERVAAGRIVVFPIHPRTRQRFADFHLEERLEAVQNLKLLEPLGYLEFLRLMEKATVVITDSGGIQEETTFLRVPCLTLRDTTERPVTIEIGSNELLPMDPSAIARRVESISTAVREIGAVPPKWDGKAAERIVAVLENELRDVSSAHAA